jgi:dihydroorotase
VTEAPARVLGEDTGTLLPGRKADLVIFAAEEPWILRAEALASSGKNSPFTGHELEGRARFTIVGGEVRFERPVEGR